MTYLRIIFVELAVLLLASCSGGPKAYNQRPVDSPSARADASLSHPTTEKPGTSERLVASAVIHLPRRAGIVTTRVAKILAERLQEYSEVTTGSERSSGLQIFLEIRPDIGLEGFEISDGPAEGIRIVGNDERGLLYGVGKFLHTSTYCSHGFFPSHWRGVSVPKEPVRGMYLATHFHNYYEEAPVEDVKRYVEDLLFGG